MFTALGIHPEDAQHLSMSVDEALSELSDFILKRLDFKETLWTNFYQVLIHYQIQQLSLYYSFLLKVFHQ